DAWNDRATRALMGKIAAAPHPEMSGDGDEYLGAELRLVYDDGRVLRERVGAALGRGPDNPLPPEALADKFANCAARALPAAAVTRLQRALLEIVKLHPLFAGEVRGVDLRRRPEPALVAAIDRAMDEYAVLVFRGQPLSQ